MQQQVGSALGGPRVNRPRVEIQLGGLQWSWEGSVSPECSVDHRQRGQTRHRRRPEVSSTHLSRPVLLWCVFSPPNPSSSSAAATPNCSNPAPLDPSPFLSLPDKNRLPRC